MIRLSGIEKALLKFALEKGYLSFGDFYAAYTQKYARKNAIEKFFNLGLIRQSHIGNRFEIVKERIKKIL